MSPSCSQGPFYWVKNYFTFYWHVFPVLSSKVLLPILWENTGPYHQVYEPLPLSPGQSHNSNAMYKAGSQHPAVLSLEQPKLRGPGHLWTQVGSPVKSLLRPPSQNLSGAHLPTPNILKNYASHRSDSRSWSKVLSNLTNFVILKFGLLPQYGVSIKKIVIQGLFNFSGSHLPSPIQQRIIIIITLNLGDWSNLLYLYTDLDLHDWDSEHLELGLSKWPQANRRNSWATSTISNSSSFSLAWALCPKQYRKKNKPILFSQKAFIYSKISLTAQAFSSLD